MNRDSYDVIISGGGPVGLFLACELALARCSVLVLERAEDPSSPLKRLPFGMRGLNTLSVEALYRRGLLDELQIHHRMETPQVTAGSGGGKPPRGGGHFAGLPFLIEKVDFSQWPYRLPSSTKTHLISEMEELETVLALRAESLGVEIRRGFPVTEFDQTLEGVTVQAGDHAFSGRWLVGCDGSRSVIRKKGGFEFVGTEPEFTGYTALVDLADAENLRPGRNVTPNGMYVQSQPGYIILQDFDGGVFHQSGLPITREYLQEKLRYISGTNATITALHVATTWTDRARQAATYRKGRVLLAGDAAHIHSPLGGQGLNLGLGDAMNLGWKLAAEVHGNAPEGLLDSYETERHPLGARVLDWSRAQVAIMKPNEEGRALRTVFQDLLETRDGATYIAARVWGVLTQYDLGGDHPLVGQSVPNFELENDTKIGELMHGGQGLLLDLVGKANLQALASEFGDQMKYVSGRVKVDLGLTTILVRPDGFVAWASDQEPDEAALRQALARIY